MRPGWVDACRAGRTVGQSWDTIAALIEFDGTGDVLRKRYTRAIARQVREAHAPTFERLAADVARSVLDVSREAREHKQLELPLPSVTPPLKYDLPGRVKALVLPDTQVEAGVPLEHFRAAGRYAAAKEVDVIVHLGDWGNFDSLSTHESALSKEGLRLRDDIVACTRALQLFNEGLDGYDPEVQIITLGNHEDRLRKYIDERPELVGSLSLPDFEGFGWTVYPFLQPVCINGVYFCHYFTRTAKGWAGNRPHPNAQTMIRREMVSCVAGHTPGLDTYIHPAGGGAGLIRGTTAGSFYQHDETWMGPQGNRYWRGCLLLNELRDGYYALVEISMEYLLERYA